MARDTLDVVGIGSMVLDRMHRAARIVGPEQKGLLLELAGGGPVQPFVGGVVLNHLGWAAVLGLRVGIFGRQADDEAGRFLREAMHRLGIERQLVLDGSASSVAEIFVDEAGGRAIYMAPGATAETDALHVRRHHAEFIARARILSTEVSQLPLEAALEALRIARAAGLDTVVDLDVPPADAVPALGDEATLLQVLSEARVLKAGRDAAAELLPDAGRDPLDLARELRARFLCDAVLVTAGEAGCAIAASTFEGEIPAYPVKAIDTTGAGDAFLGGVLAGLRLGLPWDATGRLAAAAGAACAERMGAFPADPAADRARILELYDGPPVELGSLPGPAGAAAPGEARPGADEALATFDVVMGELSQLRRRLDTAAFAAAVRAIREAEARGGRVHVTGVGKAGHVARYAAASLASTGTPAAFLCPTESVHGGAGQVVPGDVVIAVSQSGETEELRTALEALRRRGVTLVAVTGTPGSWLAREADVVLHAGVGREGGPLGLAPRASAAAQLVVLASLSAELEAARGFTSEQFHETHPGGTLGRRTAPKPGRK